MIGMWEQGVGEPSAPFDAGDGRLCCGTGWAMRDSMRCLGLQGPVVQDRWEVSDD